MEVPLLSRAVSVRSILFFLLSVATLLLGGFVPIWAKTKPRAFDRTLFAYVQFFNPTTGEIIINGGDSRGPTTPGLTFTWKWGDGTSNNGFFPQTKTYTDVSRNYVAKVISNYPDGQKDSVSILIEFVTPTISTVAGPNNIGDTGPATLATLNDPEAVAVDAAGNTYITEGVANRIRKISPDGIITTIAGTGKPGFSGDGGPATAALINYPTSIAVDASGTIYFSDWYNNRIRKISTSGIITTAAGNGTLGFSGDGGLATAAALGGAYGIAVATNGVIYIADWNNQRIRKVGTDGIITTIAGTGAGGFSGDNGQALFAQLRNPSGVAVDASGNVYIGDYGNWRIRKVATNGIITTIAGNGTQGSTGDNGSATSAQISFFAGPLVDASGNVYITSFFNNQIRKVSTNGTITRVTGLANGAGYYNGDGIPATDAALASPLGLAIASGNLFIADRGNQRIRKVNTSGIISTIAGPNNSGFSGDGGLATSARLNSPVDVKGDGTGNFFFAETSIGRIRKVDAGGIVTTVAGMSLAGFSGDGGPATSARLTIPYGILPDGNGNFYIADTYNNRIRKVNTDGVISTIAGNGTAGFGGDNGPAANAQLKFPYNVALDKAGNLYIADSDNNRIRKINTNGTITTIVGTGIAGYGGDGGAATLAQINFPTGLALDAANNLYISDNRNHRIRRVTPGGIISTIAGTGTAGYSGSNDLAVAAQLSYPFGIAVSGNGTVYFSDNGNVRVRRIGTDGIIVDVAGTATRGFLGDGASATQAQLGNPFGIGLDGYGNLLIADNANARIRKIACIDPPTVSLIASSTNVCVGDVVSLTIGGSNINSLTYQFFGNVVSATNNSISVSAVAGLNSYSVTATTPTGCSASATIKLQSGNLYSTKSGNWDDPSVWSCGRTPLANDIPTISNGHSLTLTSVALAKNVIFNGKLDYGLSGKLYLGSTNLGKLTIAEQKQVASQIISPSGGTLIVNNVDPALNGLRIQVPNKSYPSNKTFKVSYAPIIKHSAGIYFNPITPLIRIENGGEYADSLMSVTIPIHLSSGQHAVAMMYSKEKGFEVLPTISLSGNEITLTTNHFAASNSSGINNKMDVARNVAEDPINLYGIVIGIIGGDFLDNLSIKTDYIPQEDGWEFDNRGSYPANEGICSGMAVTSLWYYENMKLLRGNLYNNIFLQDLFLSQSDTKPNYDKIWMDNTKGIQFATAVQKDNVYLNFDYLFRKSFSHVKSVNDPLVKRAITYHFLLGGSPLLINLFNPSRSNGHQLVVYGVAPNGLYVYDPNIPAKESFITYSNANGLRYIGSLKRDAPPEEYVHFSVFPYNYMHSPDYLKNQWDKVQNGTIGNQNFPAYSFLINGNENLKIEEESELTTSSSFSITAVDSPTLAACTSCTIILIKSNGEKLLKNSNGFYQLESGKKHRIGFWLLKDEEWYDFKWITINVPPSEYFFSYTISNPSSGSTSNSSYTFYDYNRYNISDLSEINKGSFSAHKTTSLETNIADGVNFSVYANCSALRYSGNPFSIGFLFAWGRFSGVGSYIIQNTWSPDVPEVRFYADVNSSSMTYFPTYGTTSNMLHITKYVEGRLIEGNFSLSISLAGGGGANIPRNIVGSFRIEPN